MFPVGELSERRPYIGANRDAALGQSQLGGGMERKRLETRAQFAQVASPLAADCGDDVLGEHRRQTGDGTSRAAFEAGPNQDLRPDEDVKPLDQIRLEILPGLVGDLEAGQIRRFLPEARDHIERNRIPTAGGELVHVERERLARGGRGREVAKQRDVVEAVVRRPDHGNRVRSRDRRVLGQGDRVSGGLRAAMNRDGEAAVGRSDEELGREPPFRDREQDPLTRRPEREHAVEPSADEEVDVRLDRVLVHRRSFVTQRSQSRGQRASEHAQDTNLRLVSGLRTERDGPVFRITLAKPERRNAFDAALIAELTEAFADVGDTRAVVLAGDGESFCAGADVEWQRSSIDLSYEENVEDALRLYRMLETIDRCPAPVVARVQGYALGGGSGLIACTDIPIAAEDVVFGFSEVKLGIIPAVISPFVFARIGPTPARRYFLTGERFDAETALRIGLIGEVTADLDGAVERVLAELLAAGPEATRAAKQLTFDRPDGQAAAQIAARLRTSPEGQEGLRAFLDKRTPAWRSRNSS